ncbi:Maf-like protein, nucleoside-triphosphate diphosphatase, ASMTL-like protein [Schizosaccharomyces osmophilus]|uniref:Maf-like protein, nucleoside-triphosphate diphosphatase, ASMTL-like protein n=1 Tax=Schizosaccharomyces osmophilus TaxID=2545709 RepID=A0AAF0AU95_9SCHI|nr:Maf-like protein, nucleoside-triphosphate diphosphatase, ASMTL-like protein [Schizosaccharomyces osmophilus]WBW70594.1 Maf-like protein, nucleoside-triphosphate diphosphatase, ASMTL-like protein [Schizosaccharomyces osmophilus]
MDGLPPSYESHFTLDTPVHQKLKDKRVILASGSPRRKELFRQMGFSNIEVSVSGFPENLSKSAYVTPWEYAADTSSQKALAVYQSLAAEEDSPDVVVAADTVLILDSEIIEKPADPKNHLSILKKLRDSRDPHKIFTAVTVIVPMDVPIHPGYVMKTHLEETQVKFDPSLTNEFLEAYVRCGEGLDKAGGYGIQGFGALLVESIQGDYTNIVGLPLRATYRLLEEALDQGNAENY